MFIYIVVVVGIRCFFFVFGIDVIFIYNNNELMSSLLGLVIRSYFFNITINCYDKS